MVFLGPQHDNEPRRRLLRRGAQTPFLTRGELVLSSSATLKPINVIEALLVSGAVGPALGRPWSKGRELAEGWFGVDALKDNQRWPFNDGHG
jgi:hypothetical protein